MKSTASWLPVLSANPWFGGMSAPEQRALLAVATPVRLRRGEMLFRQGDAVSGSSGGFYGLLDGTIKASSLREDGKEAILAVLEPGNWFGEISLIDGLPRTHDATALRDSELLLVPGSAFKLLMKRNAFARAVSQLLAARVRSLYGMVEDATLRSTRARVARRLLLLARGDASLAHDARPVLPVSHESLAMMLGVTRQTLSKELKALARGGVIVPGYGRIEIASVAGLEVLAAA